jgi:hypothetical protein
MLSFEGTEIGGCLIEEDSKVGIGSFLNELPEGSKNYIESSHIWAAGSLRNSSSHMKSQTKGWQAWR